MIRRRPMALALGPGFALAVLVITSCTRAPDPEASIRAHYVAQQASAADAGAAWHLTSNGEVFFDDGWAPMETGQDGVHGEVWRWMARSSLLRLRTHPTPMKLEITGWVPLHILAAPPMITLRWKGNRVDAFLAPAGHFTRTLLVTEAMQAGSTFADFTMETSTVASERNDPRELGFALAEVRWEVWKD
jgi:hypothetical protein